MKPQSLTGIFKLHNPSQWKIKLLNKIFVEYTLAMQDMLTWSRDHLDWIRNNGQDKRGKYTGDSVQSVLPNPASACMASALKDGLKTNVASMLASYLELDSGDKQEAGFPASRDPRPDTLSDATAQLTSCFLLNQPDTTKKQAEAIEDYYKAKMLLQIKGNVMPLNFCRSRDFTILVDVREKRYFAWLKLSSQDDEANLQTNIDGNNLVDISTGEFFTKRKGTGVLFPLEMGNSGWQNEKFLRSVLQHKATVQAGKLVKKDGEYFLHVSFAFDCPEPYEPETYLGIDRGVFYTMAFAIIDRAGQVIMMEHIQDGFRDEKIQASQKIQKKQQQGQRVAAKDYRRQSLDSILHVLVNNMIALALEHKSMIVLENLNIQIKGKFYKSAWKKLHSLFEYKCKLAGVPFKKEGVWAAYTSKICINCGELAERTKRDGQTPVICRHCGYVGHADECAAVNIARRAMYRKADWGGTKEKAGDYMAFHRSFANQAALETRVDLRKYQIPVQLVLF